MSLPEAVGRTFGWDGPNTINSQRPESSAPRRPPDQQSPGSSWASATVLAEEISAVRVSRSGAAPTPRAQSPGRHSAVGVTSSEPQVGVAVKPTRPKNNGGASYPRHIL